jgi:putative acetyltransferase
MTDGVEICLGNGQHTLFSHKQWYLVVLPGSTDPFLECRFQTDAPDRTGYPAWTQTEFCVLCEGDVATLRLPLRRLPQPGDPNRFASVPDASWKRAVEECAKLRSDPASKEFREAMDIRRATPTDREVLLDIWLRSVRATHTFVSEEDIQSMIPQVRDYLASSESELWVLSDDSDAIKGFMRMSGSEMESLFLAPEFQRRGAGRRLVRHAQTQHGELTVDVNEQNVAARAFYEACGFVVEGRSELDDQGRPYPLLHMRLVAGRAGC